MTKYKTLLALIAIIFSVQTLRAYNLKQISNKEGLLNNIVLSLYQDKKGFMWFGSSEGLSTYDGRGLELFKPIEGKESLSGSHIRGMIEAQEGTFWILSDKGLDKVDKIRQTVTPFANIRSNQNLCKDSNNHIFVLQENGSMLVYDDVNNNFVKLNIDEISDAEVSHIMVTSDDRLFVSKKNGQAHIYKINLTEEGNISLSDLGIKKLAEGIISAYSEGDLVYFLDEKYTLFEYDLMSNRKYYIYNLQSQVSQRGQISSIVKQNENYYVAFRNNGLIALKNYPERPVKYDIESIDVRSGVISLWKDIYQDVIWIASDGQGVFMYSTDTYSLRPMPYNSFAQQVNKPATAFFLDKENALWIATAGDGAVRLLDYNFNSNLANNRIETYSIFNSKLNNNFLTCFAPSKHNIFWIGSQIGLNYYSYENNLVRKLTMNANIAALRNVSYVKEINDSTLIIATNGGGLIKANILWTNGVPWMSKAEQIRAEGENAPKNFTTLYQDGKEIWAGTEKTGLYKLDISSLNLSKVDFGNEISFESVYAIATDRNDNLWIATDHGLIKYHAGKSTVYNKNIVFGSNAIKSILPDSHGNLWLSTNSSIIKFNPSSASFLSYDHATGLSITEFGRGACYNAIQQGVFFFGGQNGYVAIEENMNETKEYNPPVLFNNLNIMGKVKNIYDYRYGNKLKIDHTQNFFDVSFIALDYVDGNNYTYFYKLGDNSATWIENGQRSTVSFTDMPSGTYDLQVKYVNKVSGFESPAYKLTINIVAPWYESYFAYFVYALLLLGAAYLTYKILTERNRKSKETELSQIESRHKEELFKAKLGFFSSVTERFVNPLTLIYGFSNCIQNDEEAEGNINRHAEMIQYNAEKIDLEISEIVEFGKLETGDKKFLIEKLPVSELVENIADSFESICKERNIRYEKNIVENINWNSDRRFLFTIVTNILSGAINKVENNGFLKVNLSENQNKLRLVVSNSGEKAWGNTLKLFDRYEISAYLENNDETASLDRLKLAISQRLIEILGGSLRIEQDSEQNMLNYIVELNSRESDETNGESIKAEELSEISEIKLSDMVRRNIKNLQKLPAYTINESNPTILVADRDIDILHFVSDNLSPDFNVIPANTKEMLEQIVSEGKAEIILADISIEEWDAGEFVTNMKSNQLTNHIPIILIGPKTILDEQEMALTSAGADMCIAKPFNIDELKLSVYRMLSKKGVSKSTSNSRRNTFEQPSDKMIQSDDNKFVQTILDIINENVSKRDLSVSFIASRMGMSTRHLYRKLNDIEAESPLHMIRDCRLHIAQNLLLNSSLTVDEIIYKSGFYNRGTFFKVFAEKFNCTPREYREKNCEDLSK